MLYANSIALTIREKHGYDNDFQIQVLTTEWVILLMCVIGLEICKFWNKFNLFSKMLKFLFIFYKHLNVQSGVSVAEKLA